MVLNTPFTQKHIALGAKMAAFAGYNMPISYAGINEEHLAVRNRAGLFDVSHMGEFIIKGENALKLIESLTTNDVGKLTKGKAQYSCLTNKTGGIVDDLLVYCLEENKSYMLVVNASNIEKDWDWVQLHNTYKVEMHNISRQTCLLALQGPLAKDILQKLTDTDLSQIQYYNFARGKVAGVENVIISATGYTGSGGFELYFEEKGEDPTLMWESILGAGKEFGIQPVGLGARDTLRLEMGFCLYGNDIDDATTPLEAGLGWIVNFKKSFTASDILSLQKKNGPQKKLVGIELLERGIPRHGHPITDSSGKNIGAITSGTQSPSLGKGIGLGYVDIAFAKPGTEIAVEIRGKLINAVVVKTPFVKI